MSEPQQLDLLPPRSKWACEGAMGAEPREQAMQNMQPHERQEKESSSEALMPTAPTYTEAEDGPRIRKQRELVFAAMASGSWRTLAQLEMLTGFPQASISARLRDFRKAEFGGHTVERRRVECHNGLWEYRIAR